MTHDRRAVLFSSLALVLAAGSAPGPVSAQGLRVVQSGPNGELDRLDQADEIRVVFSEPMVALGRIPRRVGTSFFSIAPAVPGAFRWTGTDTLVFTPAEGSLPYATRFEVAIAAGATSLSGAALPQIHRFSFTTPTARLESARFYRKGGRFDAPLVVALRFNQPVDAGAVLPHLRLDRQPHAWNAPPGPDSAGFAARVAAAREAARASAPLPFAPAREWDEESFPRDDALLVIETLEAPAPDSWLRLGLGPELPGRQGTATPGRSRHELLQLEPTFFVEGFRCHSACDPDRYNPIQLRGRAQLSELAPRLVVRRLGGGGAPQPLERGELPSWDWPTSWISLDQLGFATAPNRRYQVTLAADLVAEDGQVLGYEWRGEVDYWHRAASTSFGGGHGVWESGGGARLPFYARNLQSVEYWLQPIAVDALLPTMLRLREQGFGASPPVEALRMALAPEPDAMQSYGLDLSSLLGAGGHGLFWAAIRGGEPIPRAPGGDPRRAPRATLVQVTNLGLNVKDSPRGSLVLVTRLDDGAPVAGAQVAFRNLENRVVWQGSTDREGVALAPAAELRDPSGWWWDLRFVVTAKKDGDVAYLASDWNEGVEPWYFDLSYDLAESKPLLRGSVFSDRGVYRPGEPARLKAVLRSDTANGIELLEPGATVALALLDSLGEQVEARELTLGEWSSAEWELTLPEDGPLGEYRVTATVAGQGGSAGGQFLVAAFRRPDFRVDAALDGDGVALAGVQLAGRIEGRYLFGAPMAGRALRWKITRERLDSVPEAVRDRFPDARWLFLDQRWDRPEAPPEGSLAQGEAELDQQGSRAVELGTEIDSGSPYRFTLEGEVTDASRQALAGRASVRVEAAPFYVGVKRPPYFADVESGLDSELVAAGLDGAAVPGVAIAVSLTQVQWHSVRRAEGGGFYTWETERREVAAGEWTLTSGAAPVPLALPIGSGGYYVLRARAEDGAGRFTETATSFYALGSGYTAWARHDHNRVELVAERSSYRPGETARLMIQSPWESATALLTAEREGVRWHRRFQLDSTQQTVEVPIAEADVPNLYVSVLLVKGRTRPFSGEDTSDPGRPAFRLGYVQLAVEDETRRLAVEVTSDREEYRPGATARVDVAVRDHAGGTGAAEVTLWAVDYGVLSLTGYRTPDLLSSVYVPKALQVMNQDSRQNIIQRRVLASKGEDAAGGGGVLAGPGPEVREDFRALAFWLGSLITGDDGRARAEVELPESLTTYRVMAVAADRESRFGWGEREIRTSQPVLLVPAFPRFLARGDRAHFGAVLHNRLERGGRAQVSLHSLDPDLLAIDGSGRRTVEIGAESSREVRFDARGLGVGEARLRMTVRLGDEGDAFEQVLPVRVLAPAQASAAYGQASPAAGETVELPEGVVPGYGGLDIQLSATALVGLGEGARYLVDYPYGCAEQRASAALALALAADLGQAFRLPGIEPEALRTKVDQAFGELAAFQCADGGFAYWKGGCPAGGSPYLTSWVLHVLGRGLELGHAVPPGLLERGLDHLQRRLGEAPPERAASLAGYHAWQAFAVKVLAEGGRNADSPLTRLSESLDRIPVFAMAYLLDAAGARGGAPELVAELERRIGNAVLREGGASHVEELDDPELLWLWSSNARSTAIVLASLLRRDQPDQALVASMARWLLRARERGRWGNTQENATALEALADYYRALESEPPDFTARVSLGDTELGETRFRGRRAESWAVELAMEQLLALGQPGEALALGFERQGRGRLYYSSRLRYADDAFRREPLEQGIRLERRYAPRDGSDRQAFRAGELVEVALRLHLTKERRFVAVRDPVPAGFEPIESWFATTAVDLARGPGEEEDAQDHSSRWLERRRRGGFDHVERHDDRVELFATRLAGGEHEFRYLVRATTAGSFVAAPARAEEMYSPEVYGLTASERVEVEP